MARFLSNDDVRGLITVAECVEVMEDLFKQQAAGLVENLPRRRIRFGGRTGATLMGGTVLGSHAWGVRHSNVTLLYDTNTGALDAVIEPGTLAWIRTGAASGVAARHMSKPDASTAALLGAGRQAVTQLEAIAAVRPLTEVRVFSRNEERRRSFVEEQGPRLGLNLIPVSTPEAAVRGAHIVVAITTAQEPVFDGAHLDPGACVIAAGSNSWRKREVDETTIERASLIAADNVEQARIECGELIWAVERGALRWSGVHELAEVVGGALPGRPSEDAITLFESQGHRRRGRRRVPLCPRQGARGRRRRRAAVLTAPTSMPHSPPNTATWLGHATVLIEVDGARILTDPLLRDRLFHLQRHGPTPTAHLEGRIDAVVISHLHHDHLDLPSLRLLDPSTPIVVPRGAGALLRAAGLPRVIELARGESWRLDAGVTIEATPAHHSGRRPPLGPTVEAAGYVIDGSHRVYFAGDTGLFPEMANLEAIDLALLPVGGWGPWLRGPHLDPRSAAAALARIRPARAIPIHWGTFWPRGLLRTSRFHAPGARFAARAATVAPDVEVHVLTPGAALSLPRRTALVR